jgi:protein-tyrosine phosphatase
VEVRREEKIYALNIKSVIDLRTPNERKSKPDKIPAGNGINFFNIPFYYNKKDMSNNEFYSMIISRGKVLDFEAIIKEIYNEIAFESGHKIKEILNLLANKNNLPALIHCTGGKDRTGVISALIQLLMGVELEQVINDYLASNGFIEQRMKKTMRFIRLMSLFRVSKEKIKPMLIVRRDYLEEILDKIFADHKTIENYLYSFCGVEQNRISELRQLLIEK